MRAAWVASEFRTLWITKTHSSDAPLAAARSTQRLSTEHRHALSFLPTREEMLRTQPMQAWTFPCMRPRMRLHMRQHMSPHMSLHMHDSEPAPAGTLLSSRRAKAAVARVAAAPPTSLRTHSPTLLSFDENQATALLTHTSLWRALRGVKRGPSLSLAQLGPGPSHAPS